MIGAIGSVHDCVIAFYKHILTEIIAETKARLNEEFLEVIDLWTKKQYSTK